MMSPRFGFSRMSGARAVVAFEFANSSKGSLEDGEVADLYGADGGEDCHDVEVRDLSHKRVAEAASTLLDCSKVNGAVCAMERSSSPPIDSEVGTVGWLTMLAIWTKASPKSGFPAWRLRW